MNAPDDEQPPDEQPAADSWSATSGGAGVENELTRAEFRGRVRALFRRYHPPDAAALLRDHERDFIERGAALTPSPVATGVNTAAPARVTPGAAATPGPTAQPTR